MDNSKNISGMNDESIDLNVELNYKRLSGNNIGIGYINKEDKLFGQLIVYNLNFDKITHYGFSYNNNSIGVCDMSNGIIIYYSVINPGVEISEGEYRKELAKIRMGLINSPCPQIEFLEKRLPNNWEEILFPNGILRKVLEDDGNNAYSNTISFCFGGKK
jgi:hypothetical protein